MNIWRVSIEHTKQTDEGVFKKTKYELFLPEKLAFKIMKEIKEEIKKK